MFAHPETLEKEEAKEDELIKSILACQQVAVHEALEARIINSDGADLQIKVDRIEGYIYIYKIV